MTRQRNDSHSTEFGLWLRQQQEIDSKYGYTASNLDFVWTNYKTKEWMLLEEKRFNSPMTYAQSQQFRVMHRALISVTPNYRGFYLIQFEHTSPEDGRIYLSNIEATKRYEITKEQLIQFLQFDFSYMNGQFVWHNEAA